MVALRAELGPRDAPGTYNWTGGPNQPAIAVPIPVRPGWDVFVAAGADVLPGTGTSLGTFEHNSGTDPLYTLNHAVVDHIRSLLYPRDRATPANITPPPNGWVNPPNTPPPNNLPVYTGPNPPGTMFPNNFTDMQVIRIKRHGAIMLSTSMTAVPVTMAVAATATLAPLLQPGAVVSPVADNIFVSNNPAIATVAATGVVTGVAPGTTVVTITHKGNGLVAEAQVTVTGAGVFLTGTESEPVVDKDGNKTYVPYEEPEAEAKVVEGEPKSQGFVLNKADGGDTSGEPHVITEAESAKASIQEDEPVTTPENTPDNDPEEDHTPADTKALKAKQKAKEEDDDDDHKKKSKK